MNLEDGFRHRIELERTTGRRMTVSVDGRTVIDVTDSSFSDGFDGVEILKVQFEDRNPSFFADLCVGCEFRSPSNQIRQLRFHCHVRLVMLKCFDSIPNFLTEMDQ